MIADLNPYPAMKDSGVPWLGEVPAHWEVCRLKSRLVRSDAGVWGDEFDSDGTVVLRSTEQTIDGRWRIANPARIRLSQSQRDAATLAAGDLVVTKSSGSPAHIGKTSLVSPRVARLSCCFSNFMQRLRVDRGTSPELVWRSLNSPVGREQLVFQSTTTTGLGNLNGTILGNCRFAVPPLPEQAAIVRFLDHADWRIRRYIRAKQKLIKLLDEQKQAIIHRAVTRGLDPNVRLKPSGVEWLGHVPEHWQVMRVKQCAYRISKGTTPSTEGREILEAGPVRFIKAENVSGGRILDRPGCFIDEQTNAVLRRSQLREHDILFVIAGATLGKIAVVESAHLPANTNQAVAFIRPKTRVNHRFLSLWLQSSRIRELIWLNAVQSAQPNLSMADLGSFVVPVPPLMEQRQILDAVGMKVVPVDNGIDRAHHEIDLLREYRTRLIADVVTGKLDVREAAARLPEEEKAVEEVAEAEEGPDAGEAEGEGGEAEVEEASG